jgi:hypothetical protein
VLETQVIQGRPISRAEIGEIQELIAAHPGWSRWRLSRVLAQRWSWYSSSGQLKDMAARTLLLKLQQRQWIQLPQRRHPPARRGPQLTADLFDTLSPEPVEETLGALQPLRIEVLGPRHPRFHRFERYLVQHHYLSYSGPVGENIGYLVQSQSGQDLACLLFGAAAWKAAARDRWIGWPAEQRAKGLGFIANNSRFLVLPKIPTYCYTSSVLSCQSNSVCGSAGGTDDPAWTFATAA